MVYVLVLAQNKEKKKIETTSQVFTFVSTAQKKTYRSQRKAHVAENTWK